MEGSTSNSVTSCPIRDVPPDLLPTTLSKYTTEWAQNTYGYANLFDSDIRNTAFNNNNDINKWISIATKMYSEIRDLGFDRGREHLVSRAISDHNMMMGANKDIEPRNLDDIISIVTDRDWYASMTEGRRRTIHMLSYGIFRQGNNSWALQCVREWMATKNIKYSSDSRLTNDGNRIIHNDSNRIIHKRQMKGFVYSILVGKVSGHISERFMNACKRAHKEFIAARKCKNVKHWVYESISINNSEAYIVKVNNNDIEKYKKGRHEWLADLQHIISGARENGITKNEIACILSGNNNGKQNYR